MVVQQSTAIGSTPATDTAACEPVEHLQTLLQVRGVRHWEGQEVRAGETAGPGGVAAGRWDSWARTPGGVTAVKVGVAS